MKLSNTYNVQFNITHVGDTAVAAYLRDDEGSIYQIYSTTLSFNGGRPSNYRIFGPSVSTRLSSNTTSDLCSHVLLVRGYSFMGDPLPLSLQEHAFRVEVWDDIGHIALNVDTRIYEIIEEGEKKRNRKFPFIFFFSYIAMQLGIQFSYPVRKGKYLVRIFLGSTQLYSGPLYCPSHTEYIEVA